eukprot:6422283-Ditylum_brightwellii.AAC.1
MVGTVIIQWKDSKVFQAVSTAMQPRATTVTRHLGQEVMDASFPNDIVFYQQYMGGVIRGI